MSSATSSVADSVDALLERAAILNHAGAAGAARALLTDALSKAGALARERGTTLVESDAAIRLAFKHGQASIGRVAADQRFDFYPEFVG